MKQTAAVSLEVLAHKIFLVRGVKVMLDSDLARLYGVGTKQLNRAVARNSKRFPPDFRFQLSLDEVIALRFQFGTSKEKRGGRRYLPYVFTEHGVAMLSSVLRSDRAVQMNIFIVRAFIKLRELLSTNKELAEKIDKLERDQREHGEQLRTVYEIVKQLIDAPIPTPRKIGFDPDK